MWTQPGDQVIAPVQTFRKPPILPALSTVKRRSDNKACAVPLVSYYGLFSFMIIRKGFLWLTGRFFSKRYKQYF